MRRSKGLKRCPWVPEGDRLYREYHDREWGVPVRNDRKIFEFLVLESAQAGLSWATVLRKRKNYRKAFAGFNPQKVARFGAREKARLMHDAGIIRNRQKIDAAIENAKRFLEVQKEFGAFSRYMWQWVGGQAIQHRLKTLADYPVTIAEAKVWSDALKRRGFKFIGPTVIYAHMQAVGMVNDHVIRCFRYNQV